MMRRPMFLILLLLMLPIVLVAQVEPAYSQVASQARWIHASLNALRMGQDRAPVAYNATLEQMALDQARYLASMRAWPVDPHAGRRGENIRTRATFRAYDWDTYGRPEFITVGEIVYKGTRENAISFWETSPNHRPTVMNPRYREIGVAAVHVRDNRYIFVVVFGSRPNVLTATADPRAETLYLTNETGSPGIGEWLRNATEFRLFDGDGRPLGGWQAWQAQVPLPDDAGDRLFILYHDAANTEVMSAVSLLEPDIPLLDYADAWALAGGGIVATPTPAATPTPTPPPVIRLSIYYDDRSLILANFSSAVANARPLRLVGESLTLSIGDLDDYDLRGSLNRMLNGDCLIVSTGTRRIDVPQQCAFRTATFRNASTFFWATEDFAVERNGEVIARCRAADEFCQFVLPPE